MERKNVGMRVPWYFLITIIIAGIVTGGIYLFTIQPSTSPKISVTGTVNITGGGHYTLISDNGTVYYPLNPEVIHFPPGTSVYWEAVPADSANLSSGIPVEILVITEYVPPLDTVRVNFTINGESAPVPPIATTPPRV
ncbi:hypothetical protein [Methanoregula sp. UBA64]|jgi:hypothetical protein|uniref:hypothetical protein n=1 Tax=Methanoregula sp. UBA64 TaxID=1915554 RepID=UPI0025E0DB8C|nr:hypothetical protein [Methanoregula sp. UBA64]